MKQQIARHIAWPKHMNIHRLWVWLPPLHNKPEAVIGKNMTISLLESGENSNKSLLAGEFSHGRCGGASLMQVPRGFLAVYVGPELRRFVIPMSCLSSPDFRVLMDRVAEEYGFEEEGALKIPCDEEDFEHILVRSLANNKKNDKKKGLMS